MSRILLGEASVLLNTIIDLIKSSSSSATTTSSSASSSSAVSSATSKISVYTLKTFRLERIRLGYSVELEKYPKEFEILLNNYEFRTKLYNYDQIFNKIEEILILCIHKQQEKDNNYNENFNQKLIEDLMLSEIGQSIIYYNNSNRKYKI